MGRHAPRETLLERRGLVRAAGELFKFGDYDRGVGFLRAAQAPVQAPVPAGVPEPVRVLIQACREMRAAADTHRRAYLRSHEQELELLQELKALLALPTSGLADSQEGPRGNERPEHARPGHHESVGRQAALPSLSGLILRVRRFLGRGPSPSATSNEDNVTALGTREAGVVGPCSAPLDRPPLGAERHEARFSTDGSELDRADPPWLDVHLLGSFRVFSNDRPIEDWPNGKSKAVFKHLLTNRERPVPRDVLMELFWPAARPDAARNSLNVAIYGLRKALSRVLPAFSYVLFRDGCYSLNPELRVWVDCEAFQHHLSLARELERLSQEDRAIQEYRAAEILYQGEFLSEDRYEDWLAPLRQSLRDDYLAALARLSRFSFEHKEYEACVTLCEKILAVDSCNEEPHRRLMRCYSRLGQPHLALRQGHTCVSTLSRELGLACGQETTELLAAIRRGEAV